MANPTISISSPAAGAILASQSVAMAGTASDNVGLDVVELSSDGTNWVPATGTTSWSGTLTLPEGSNTIYARATDAFGNEATASRNLVIDTTDPIVAITYPPDGATLESLTVVVSGTASDNVGLEKVELGTDGQNWVLAAGTASWSGTLTLVEGGNTIHVRAMDQAGNVVSDTISVTVSFPRPPSLLVGAAIGGVVAAAGAAALLIRRRKRRS